MSAQPDHLAELRDIHQFVARIRAVQDLLLTATTPETTTPAENPGTRRASHDPVAPGRAEPRPFRPTPARPGTTKETTPWLST